MFNMSDISINLNNWDLITVGIIVSSTLILGFVVFFNNRKSITNRTFLYFSLITAIWGIINYFSYKFIDPVILLWLFRFIMFFAVLQAFYLYRFLRVFPNEKYSFSYKNKYFLTPLVIATSLFTLTPYVFSKVLGNPIIGEVASVEKGPGIIIFAIVAVGLVVKAFYLLIKKIKYSNTENEKLTSKIILIGLILMFFLIILFNFIIATVFSNSDFIPLGSLFVFPFILFTSYAIFKQKLFNVRVAGTSILVFLLSASLLLEIIFSDSLILISFRTSIFVLVLIFGISLIKNVMKEVEQRERLEKLRLKLEESNLKLEFANDKLKDLDKLKTEFLSLASHQLRSPLTAIKGYTSMILEGDYGEINKEAKEVVERVFTSSQNLTKVVEDLLNVSKIEQGGMKYEMKEFNLGDLACSVAKDLSVTAFKKGLKIKLNCENKKETTVNADENKIRQVVLNIIDNSIKYTKEGEIEVSVIKKDDKIIFSVRDNGMGMTKETKEALFKKFSRGEGGKVDSSGSGLGLYLGKQIIEAHNGRIWVESPGSGKGSTFSFELNAI